MNAPDKYIGQTLEGRYTIVNVVGSGGMSTVYGAFDRISGRSVAIKILNKKLEQNPEQIKAFINESTALSLLSHPNIVMVYNTAITNSIKYFVMEYVEGITLKSHIEHRGALPEREILYYASQILSALDYIHSKSIVHCDIKPQNIILLQNGSIKVADFGISRVSSYLDDENEKSEMAIGTVYYISPEQAQGKLARKESDLYSLGVMLYELATGSLPFYSENATEVAKMQISREPTPPGVLKKELSTGLEQVILRAMEKDVRRRYSSAEEMLVDINALRQNSKTVFGSEKNSKYRIVNRRLYEQAPNVSLTPVSLTGERNAHSGSHSIFKTGNGSRSARLPSGAMNIQRSERISSGAIGASSGRIPPSDTTFIDASGIPHESKKLKLTDKLLPILLGIILALASVIAISLGIWSAVLPEQRAEEKTIIETEAIWNTEHTEKY